MDEIKDTRPYLEMLLLPSGYVEIISEVRRRLEASGFVEKVNNYALLKETLGLKSTPMFLTEDVIEDEDFQINNTTLLAQANHLGKLATQSTSETRPLIMHYAEHSLFAFFTYSLLHYKERANSHGLNIIQFNDNSPEKTEIKICKDGFFPRVIDCYSILGAETQFAITRYDKEKKSFENNPGSLAYSNEPRITLGTLLEMRKKLDSGSQSFHFDIVDFLLIFVSSSLTRYRPYVWHKIAHGQKGSDFAWLQQSFNRFDILKTRLTEALLRISVGHDMFAAIGLWESFTDGDYKLIRY